MYLACRKILLYSTRKEHTNDTNNGPTNLRANFCVRDTFKNSSMVGFHVIPTFLEREITQIFRTCLPVSLCSEAPTDA